MGSFIGIITILSTMNPTNELGTHLVSGGAQARVHAYIRMHTVHGPNFDNALHHVVPSSCFGFDIGRTNVGRIGMEFGVASGCV